MREIKPGTIYSSSRKENHKTSKFWDWQACPEFIKLFMLNSAEHEILNAHKCKNIMKSSILQAQMSIEYNFSCL